MAGRRGQSSTQKESAVGNSAVIYLSLIGVIITASLGIWIFGVDFGFIQFGGQANLNLLYAGAIGSVLLSYYADVRYIGVVKKYYGAEKSILDWIPYVNFIGTFSKVPAMIAWVGIAIAGIVAILTFTPAGRILPAQFIMDNYTFAAIIIVLIMVVFTIMRGFYTFTFKREAEKDYRKYISEDYGSGGNVSAASYILYFMPIIRMLPIFTDINLINSVRLEMDDMRRKEEI